MPVHKEDFKHQINEGMINKTSRYFTVYRTFITSFKGELQNLILHHVATPTFHLKYTLRKTQLRNPKNPLTPNQIKNS